LLPVLLTGAGMGVWDGRHGWKQNDAGLWKKASAGGTLFHFTKIMLQQAILKLTTLPDLRYRVGAKSWCNKSPYEVWGKKYWVMDSRSKSMVQRYSIFAYGKNSMVIKPQMGNSMTCTIFLRHISPLPLPLIFKVTNLWLISVLLLVRVNDRGAFPTEIGLIDLSYCGGAGSVGTYHKKVWLGLELRLLRPYSGRAIALKGVYPKNTFSLRKPCW